MREILQNPIVRHGVPLSALVVTLAAMTGCSATLESTPLPNCVKDCNANGGFVYSLPKGSFLLQASRLPAATDLTTVTTALQTASATYTKDLQTGATNKAKLAADKAKPADPDTLAADQAAVDAATNSISIDQGLLQIAENNYDKAQKTLGQLSETFTLTQQPIIPDSSSVFVAKINHEVSRDDTLKVDQSGGLLTTASTSSTDESLNTFVSLAQTGITLATFFAAGIPLVPPAAGGGYAPAPVAAWAPNPPPPPATACSYQFAESFDPLNAADVARVNKDLEKQNATIRLVVGYGTASDAPAQSVGQAGLTTRSGLYYRQPIAVTVTVRPFDQSDEADPDRKSSIWATAKGLWNGLGPKLPDPTGAAAPLSCQLVSKPATAAQLGVVPDTRSIHRVDADDGAFTTSTHSYNFSSGMLTEHSVTRPSELTAPFQALSSLAQSIVAIPGSILKLRLDYTNNTDALVKAQTQISTDRANVVVAATQAKTALDSAQAALITSQFSIPQAVINGQTALATGQANLATAVLGAQFASPQAFLNAQVSLDKAQQTLQGLISSMNTGSTSPSSTTSK